ncbi:hypothetical protein H113_08097 [Trichophyton rubrum MR1459]|uniref:Uncharacterized protein n=2 Tax=Trichophyton rubrum TaxID=5551 RepID=F2SCA1_TRIRC|nr:uncharacterized protein TERG_00609 [Trichophyton rubrum CBS 118892]EGD84327.2 hypothetical protein TERG_00609 [Trichophyton rubrum CBS 118892]EZF90938.1 hypothetical protein H113_08097 [Trichophyton rubrum MR1459]
MKLLLADERVDPNLRVGIRRTALHIAVRKGRHAVQKLLVEHSGVDPDLKAGPLGRTPLLEAMKAPAETRYAKASSAAYIEILLEWGANIEKLLLDAGADVRAVDREGRTALALAAQYNNLETVDLLLRHGGIDPNICDYAGLTPLLSLLSATCEDHFGVISALVSCDRVDINLQDDFGNTALHYATHRTCTRSVKILLEREEDDVHIKNNVGLSPIALAATRATPLMVAIKNTSIVKWLLSMKTVDVDAENDPGMTPLKWASEAKDQSIVELLLEKMDIDTLAVCYTQ